MSMNNLRLGFLLGCCYLPALTHASFIEATMGTAVVNDATASYHNPAALVLLKNPQLIGLGSYATSYSQFSGSATQTGTGYFQSGSTQTSAKYSLPSFYAGMPANDHISLGVAVISNFFNNNPDENSILRYTESGNNTNDIDVIPAIGVRINNYFSIGASVNLSHAKMVINPISGFPTINIPDSYSHNVASANSVGGDMGILLRPTRLTLIGLNYQSAMTYQFRGSSTLQSTPSITSNNYSFKFWTPARTILSISHFFNKSIGIITTAQYIQWNIFNNVNLNNVATQVGKVPKIINATSPYHLHNSWIYTLGGQYRPLPKWIIRTAVSYFQSPANGYYQISNGANIILGASMGYDINKNITVDAGYAHAFIQSQKINISTGTNLIEGVTTGLRNAFSLKLTLNF